VTKNLLLGIAATAMGALAGVGTAGVYAQNEKLEISAFAVNMSNIATGSNAVVDITVNTWSTPEDRERLRTTMVEKDSDTLLRELQRLPARGRIRIPAARPPDPHHLALGLNLHYAW